MDKINIKICVGTACHVMGGSEILERLLELAGTRLKGIIEVSGIVCTGECYGKAEATPIVHLNDRTIFEATIDKILEEVKKVQGL